ncbi:MAG: aminopeptidase [Armatimonadetes bacterium]|nr:aminopeptidase [Armatimonadota bacterium]
MLDPRVTRLAELLCTHSTNLGPDDTVMVHAFDLPDEVTAELVRVAQATGARVIPKVTSNLTQRTLVSSASEENMRLLADVDLYEMKKATAYIGIRGAANVFENSDVPQDKLKAWNSLYGTPVHMEQRVPFTKWVVLRWPNAGMAQMAGQSTQAFEDFYFRVCTMDYSKMARACAPLEDLMNNTDRVKLVGPGTELTFSIKGIGSKPCVGLRNIPDGECFSCPVKDSVNGVIHYNTVSLYQGTDFSDIRYVFKDGRIIDATAGDKTAKVNEILDTDEGARYIGEFAIGFNPFILHPMKDTLFDEKIAGSFHFTPGNSYPPPGGNGNKSAIHWDTVMIQRPEYGGGEIWFDDRLIRKDGMFVLPELEGLNPQNLAS